MGRAAESALNDPLLSPQRDQITWLQLSGHSGSPS